MDLILHLTFLFKPSAVYLPVVSLTALNHLMCPPAAADLGAGVGGDARCISQEETKTFVSSFESLWHFGDSGGFLKLS